MKPYRWKRVLGICTAAVLGLSFPAYAVTITPLNPGTGQSSSSEPSGTGAPASQENTERLNIAQPVVSSEGAVLMDGASGKVLFSKNGDTRYYPASITKVMTALVAIKYGNLEDQVKVTDEAVITESGATLCGIKPGDTLTLEQLLYGLMLPSGNDAGAAIAVHMDGSIEAFADRMNEEAKRLGAVDSHFVNPHGLHDEDHYTTAYDLYLIFNEAFKYPKFREIIEAKAYTADYINGAGESVSRTWKCSNQFITGERDTPEGVTVLGGKTGTTKAAGYCLIIASKDNASEGNFISVVLKSDSRAHLYDNMTNIISKIVK